MKFGAITAKTSMLSGQMKIKDECYEFYARKKRAIFSGPNIQFSDMCSPFRSTQDADFYAIVEVT